MPSEQAFKFVPATATDIQTRTSLRAGECRIGERLTVEFNSKNRYALLGICEDIGPQANHGLPGSRHAWECFIRTFCNMQSNRFLDGSEIFVAGHIFQNCEFSGIEKGRKLVEELDALVTKVVGEILAHGLTPIVIGGGHNNAYPILKAVFNRSETAIHTVNLDPHADCRALEGRHSGNPFSYALEQRILDRYTVLGLHEAYNSDQTLDFLARNNVHHTFFERYLDDPLAFQSDLEELIRNSPGETGMELDLDAIHGIPASAFTPAGFSIEQARFYVRKLAASLKIHYLHLPEGAPETLKEQKLVGKTLAYLVSDFLKAQNRYLHTESQQRS